MSSHIAEDSFLDKLHSEKSKIRVGFLTASGSSFTEGRIIEHDTDTIILEVRDSPLPEKHLLIYKRSIATIMLA
ncbi:hypothetical protein LCGC14_1535360 [marine sediment metagenome]|uniref:Uncharacterized protein n=1 Tax=marine sediment metagenome TaxID=412755 RepID=A0A0F9IUQ3_9ZZZZ